MLQVHQSNPCDVNSPDSTDSTVIIRLWRCTSPTCSQTSDGFDERIHENTNAKMSQFKQSIKNVNIGHARALSPNIGKPYFNWREEAESKPCAVWFWMLKTVETFNCLSWHWFSHFSAKFCKYGLMRMLWFRLMVLDDHSATVNLITRPSFVETVDSLSQRPDECADECPPKFGFIECGWIKSWHNFHI